MRILIAYASMSGNTREVAALVARRCQTRGHPVQCLDVDADGDVVAAALAHSYQRLLLGCWTDNAGRTPAEMKQFVATLRDGPGLPPGERVAVFGTGETQWGLEYYCGAAHRLARFFGSPHPVLEIEQMPHGQADTDAVHHWVEHVLTPFETPAPC